MDTYQSYPRPQGNYPVDNYEHEEKRSTGSNSNRIYEEPIPQSSAVSGNIYEDDDDEDGVTDNLLNVEELDSQYFKPRPLTRSTIRAATTTVTRTYTRTYTRTSVPTTVNNNINRTPNNNVNRTPSSNTYNNQNSNQNINNNRSSQGQQYTKTIPSQINNNRNTANSYGQSALGSNSNRQSGTGISPGNGIGKNGLGTIPEDNDVTQNNAPSNLDAAIAPEGAGTGFHTGSTIDQDIDQIQTNSDNDQKPNSNFSFIIILIAIPIIIIIIIGSIFFLKKYKNGKRGSNIVYPDDKIRKSNLFGTLQFFNPKKPNRVSISSGSRGSRGSRTNLTSFSNDRESNVPEYSEWLEAGSNTLSMPRVSPPPLNDDKINGLTGSNFAMGVNIDNHNNNNGTLTSAQINRPQAARMAWKLEGMRVGRDSTRKSERQSLFNSFQVW